MSQLINAKIVCDQSRLVVPEDMLPSVDNPFVRIEEKGQLQGSLADNLAEIAGRVCYDSLGNGRNSADYHEHIQHVGHLSVLEHYNFTIAIMYNSYRPDVMNSLLAYLINRPGLHTIITEHSDVNNRMEIQVTMNFRSVLEWAQYTPFFTVEHKNIVEFLHFLLMEQAHILAPTILPNKPLGYQIDFDCEPLSIKLITNPIHKEQKWISMFLCGSRGFSHEMVRHGDRSAISQRSTRYVDESTSEWVTHPLVEQYFADEAAHIRNVKESEDAANLRDIITERVESMKNLYDQLVPKLKDYLIDRGVDKFTARKQARGAARGYLGNALHTEMIFSASVGQWKRILLQRLHPAADAEIREVGYKLLQILQDSEQNRYHKDFEYFRVEDSPDGIGKVLVL